MMKRRPLDIASDENRYAPAVSRLGIGAESDRRTNAKFGAWDVESGMRMRGRQDDGVLGRWVGQNARETEESLCYNMV